LSGGGPSGTAWRTVPAAAANHARADIAFYQRYCGKIFRPVLGVEQLAPNPNDTYYASTPIRTGLDDARMTVIGFAR